MKYYHATATKNVESIDREGIKVNEFEHVVFLADNPASAIKFLAIRLCQDITVYTIELPEEVESTLEESFDHNPNIFKCRAFMCPQDIPKEYLIESVRWMR